MIPQRTGVVISDVVAIIGNNVASLTQIGGTVKVIAHSQSVGWDNRGGFVEKLRNAKFNVDKVEGHARMPGTYIVSVNTVKGA